MDEFGVEYPGENGSFYLGPVQLAGHGSSGSLSIPFERVEVQDGCWTAELRRPPNATKVGLLVNDCNLGGKIAGHLTGEDHVFVLPPERHLALRVRWVGDILLHVRASDTGRELEEVLLLESVPESILEVPGPREVGRSAGPSPLHIASSNKERVFYARSPGYAWGRIPIDGESGGEFVLSVEPAGELEIAFTGERPSTSMKLNLFREGAAPGYGYLDRPLGNANTILVENLPAGTYMAQAHIRASLVLIGSAKVVVLPGQRASVLLFLEPPPTTSTVPLEGILVLPEEWGLSDLALHFLPLNSCAPFDIDWSKMVLEGGTADQYRWAAHSVPPGRYEAVINELGLRAVLETGTKGTREARIEVPPPCSVLVRPLDGTTGEAITDQLPMLFWNCQEIAIGWIASSRRFSRVRESWNQEFRTPQGVVTFAAWGRDYDYAETTAVLGSGENEVVMRLFARK